ncbi:MAG: efflux RND transporter periplasmic adaptor subunit [Acidobacteria bacterium]|nr:efflux RND transporter periplasmic adaptor subunit [Acidobacteriota bacterium]
MTCHYPLQQSRFFRRTSACCCAALAILLMVTGCSKPAVETAVVPDAPLAIQSLVVSTEPVRREVEIVGTLAGDQEVVVSSEVSGLVKVVRADLGDSVAQGQILIEMDATEYELAVARQRAALQEVLAQLGMQNATAKIPELTGTSSVRRAVAEAADAKANFDRAQSLKTDGVLSQAAYDSAEARERTSQANYSAALEQARNLVARVDNLRAQLGLAEQDLANTRVKAPFAGTIRERLVEVGQYVREQTPLAAIASTNPLKLRADVPERFFPYVKAGADVRVSVEAYSGETFLGKITRLAGAVNPQSRTFSVEARVENGARRLRPGLFARAILDTDQVDPMMRVPATAVLSFYGVQKVYVVESGAIKEKVVELGDRYGDKIEIIKGLSPGEQIAVSQMARLREGVKVTATPSSASSGSQP